VACPECLKEHKRSKNGPCPNCYRKRYQKTETGRAARRLAQKKDHQRHPERRMREVVRYREKTGYYIPAEIHYLNHAVKRLERALAATPHDYGIREPSQHRLQQSLERRDRYGNGEDLLGSG